MDISLKMLPWNKRIEMLRVLKGWTQKETAEKCNTNQKVFWNWEVGENYPRKNSQVAIATAFGVQIEEIFS